MLIFAGIAMFVGAFIINNTFSITVAQRTKEMAMLRSIGASRRQVMRAVILEAARRRPGRLGARARSPASAWPPGSRRCSPRWAWTFPSEAHRDPAEHDRRVARRRDRRDARVGDDAGACGRRRWRRSRHCVTSPSTARRRPSGARSSASCSPASVWPPCSAGSAAAVPALVGLGAVVVFVGVSVLGPVLARPVALRGRCADPGHAAGHGRARWPGRTRCATRKRTARTAASLMIGVGARGVHHDLRRLGEDLDWPARWRTTTTARTSSTPVRSTAPRASARTLAATLQTTHGVTTVAEQRVTKAEVDGTLADPFMRLRPAASARCSTSVGSTVTCSSSAPTASPSSRARAASSATP